MRNIRLFGLALAVTVPLALSACTYVYRNHGYIPPEHSLAEVNIGQTTKPELETLIGKPGAQGVLAGSSWYYVGSRWEYFGARQPREVERQVIAVRFNENGTVSNVESFGLERGKVVVLSQRVTDSGIEGVSVIRQLLGNVGRISAGDLLNDM